MGFKGKEEREEKKRHWRGGKKTRLTGSRGEGRKTMFIHRGQIKWGLVIREDLIGKGKEGGKKKGKGQGSANAGVKMRSIS